MNTTTLNVNAVKSGNTKTVKIIYWVTTGLLALFILPGIFYINSQMAIEGMHHLGLPEWFRWELSIGVFIGGLILIIPMHSRIKEWAYVALGIDYISAFIAHLYVDGPVANSFSPVVTMALLIASYVCYHKLNDRPLS